VNAKHDLTSLRFGRWLVVRETQERKGSNVAWLCRCDCGVERPVRATALVLGGSKSCGCEKAKPNLRHGHSRRGGFTPTYRTWLSMIARCTNPRISGWAKYGARGISVCERWRAFDNFLEDMGERPEGTSIDRIDTLGNYEPGNCRWATPKEQAANRRSPRRFERVRGPRLSAVDAVKIREMHSSGVKQNKIAEEFSVSKAMICRIVNGQSWGGARV